MFDRAEFVDILFNSWNKQLIRKLTGKYQNFAATRKLFGIPINNSFNLFNNKKKSLINQQKQGIIFTKMFNVKRF